MRPINGETAKVIKTTKGEVVHAWFDVNPIIIKVNELEDEGWEIFSTGNSGQVPNYVFYMRRKEQ